MEATPQDNPDRAVLPPTQKLMVEVQGLTKFYRDEPAIQDVSFSVRKGEILGFLGPNGAGKSTTMRILTGCIPPSKGTARIAGFDVFEEPLQTKRRIGYLPEIPPVHPDLTVMDQLKYAASLKSIGGSVLKDEIDRVARRARVTDVMNRLVGNLSKGYKQRVGLAQALLGDPDVLILDEPTVGLDPRQINEVRDLIKELGGHHTVILSTHIMQEVTSTCSRVLIISRGKVVADEGLAEMRARHEGMSLEEIFLKLTSV
jgi:ABC-2 type transport system ATP-binding protein